MRFEKGISQLMLNLDKAKGKQIDEHDTLFHNLKKEVESYLEAAGGSHVTLDNFSAERNSPKRSSLPKGFLYGSETLLNYYKTDKIVFPHIYEFMKWPATAIECHSEHAYMLFNFALRAIMSYSLGDSNVYLLDANASGDFNLLSSISTDVDDLDAEKNYFHYITTDKKDKETMLTELIEIMDDNIRSCCRKYPDLYSYNQQNELMFEPYNFVFIRDISNVLTDRTQIDKLIELVNYGNAAKAGIFIFFTYDQSILENSANSYYAESSRSLQRLLGMSHTFDPSVRYYETSELFVEPKAPMRVADEVIKYVNKSNPPKVVMSFKDDINKMLDSGSLWESNANEKKGHLYVPVGFESAVEKQVLDISFKGSSPHIYVGGKSGSGKSILLHNIILNSALRYSPEQLRFYLADMKGGVSFVGYKKLPHIAALSASSNRHYAESLLDLFEKEIDKRASIFRRFGVTSLEQYNEKAKAQGLPIMPYNCAIIDEFQSLFMETDDIARKAQKSIENIHKKGRSQGVFLVLCTQQPPSNIDRSQVGIKLSLICRPNDSIALIGNSGAARLKGIGRAVVNTSETGDEDSNQEFQTPFIDEEKELPAYVQKIHDIWLKMNNGVDPLEHLIYDDNELEAPLTSNENMFNKNESYERGMPVDIWLGVPAFYRKEHVKFQLHRDSQSNVAIIGADRPSALRIAGMTILQMIDAYRPTVGCKVYISDLQRRTDATYGKLSFLANCTGGVVQHSSSTELKETISEVYGLLEQRLQNMAQSENEPEVLYVILDLKPDGNFNSSRPSSISFGEPVEKSNLQKLQELITKGPDYGVHVMVYGYNFQNVAQLLNSLGDSLLNNMMEVKIGLRGGNSNKMFNYGNGEVVERNGLGFVRIPEDMGLYYKDGDNFGDPFRIYDVTGDEKLRDSAWETLFVNLPNKMD
jgi:hypothetical protein